MKVDLERLVTDRDVLPWDENQLWMKMTWAETREHFISQLSRLGSRENLLPRWLQEMGAGISKVSTHLRPLGGVRAPRLIMFPSQESK